MMKRLLAAHGRFWRDAAWTGKAHRRWFAFCSVCLALYTAYAAYLSGSALFSSPAQTVAAALWFLLIAAGVYGLLLFACARLADTAPKARKGLGGHRLFAVSALVSLAILGMAFAAAYPGGVSYDAGNQWMQAKSGEYNNWHPVFHTLLVWLGMQLAGRYPLVLVMQLAAFSLAMACLVCSIRRMGAPAWLLLMLEALTVACPLVRNTLMTVCKDGAMLTGALVLTAQAAGMLRTRGQWLQKPLNAVAFGLALAFTTMVRHNALLFTVPLALFAIFCYPNVRRKALLSLGVLIACVALVQGALYGALDVVYPSNTLEESVGLPMTVLCDQKQRAPHKLSAEADEFLLSLAPEEAWREDYVLHNYNSIKFTYPRERIASLPPQKLLTWTLEAVKADPRGAFESVNAVTDLVWGLSAGEGVESVPKSGTLEEARYGIKWLNDLGKAGLAFIDAPFALAPIGWLFTNIGVWQLLLLLAALWALYRGGVDRLMLALPALCYNLATMLLLCGPDARFFAFFMACAPFAALALVYAPKRV